jgi:poly-gamma-glutamate synthesis protein (capsule biosynthesis protein)
VDEPVTLLFGGDVHFDGVLGTQLQKSTSGFLAGIAPAVLDADVTVINLETAIATGGTAAQKQFAFRAPPSALDALSDAGVDVMSMANNHGLDFGEEGLRQTLAAVAERSSPVIGIGENEADAMEPVIVTAHGLRVAVIAATQVIDGSLLSEWTATPTHHGVASAKHEQRLIAAIAAAKKSADIVVAFLHWGTEKQTCPNEAQLALAPQLVKAGATLVVGGHAHRVQGGGFLGSAYVEYGLGNLQFIAGSAPAREAGLLRVQIVDRKIESVEWLPVRIAKDGNPTLLSGAEADAARDRWEALRPCTQLSATPGSASGSGDSSSTPTTSRATAPSTTKATTPST